MPIRGSIDRVDELLIEGWAVDDDHPSTKLAFDVLVNDRVIGRFVADSFRQDLKDADIGAGECAFSFAMPQFFGKQDVANLRLRFADSNLYIVLPTVQPAEAAVAPTASRFGGLWLDRADWMDRLGARHRAGKLSDAMAVRLFQFARDGYTVFDKAVGTRLIERLKAELDQFWQNPPEGMLIETFEPDGEMRYVPPDARWRSGRTKLLDVFAHSDLARQVIAAPPVVEFLSILFEDAPKAFQTLNFHNGNEAPMHKDTAYVKVDGNPLALAASWTALEDVEAGTGELEYFIGSHRAPDFLFGGISKWMENHAEDHPAFLESLHRDAETFGHNRGKFLARRGDVLVWHADLAHGDAPVSRVDRSRQSLVTHFCPSGLDPFYRRTSQHATLTEHGCGFASQYGPVGGNGQAG
jgi:hypothetical protein